MNLDKLSEPLSIDQIDFRVQSINKGGYATILAYKDARVDMQRLDDVYGPLGWKREHVNGNANCIVSVWNKEIGKWVGKEDTGTKSNSEAEKGLASDSFKRACFNWGIGRELYDYPTISVKLNGGGNSNGADVEWFLDETKKDKWGNPTVKAGWGLKLSEWVWYTEFINSTIVFIAAKDNHDQVRFKWGTRNG